MLDRTARALPQLLLALMMVAMAGCDVIFGGDDDDTTTSDDDDSSVGDDDDATPPLTGNCSQLGAPGVTGTVPCDFTLGGDVWQFIVAPNQFVTIAVDTVAPETTFDPRFRLTDSLTPNTYLESGDDECECAIPPLPGPNGEEYGCGEASWESEFDEPLRVHVSGFIEEACADGTIGEYVLRVSIDGEPIIPSLAIDDGPNVFGG